jgi:hypothetical protein
MFHLAFAEIVQVWLLLAILDKIVRYVFRQKDMTSVAAIHHALSHIDSAASDVGTVIYIGHGTDRTAVNPHPHAKVGATFQCFGNF